MNARRNRGFTLIELIVVLAILGAVTSLGVVTFGQINIAWNETRDRTELDARAEYALDQIRQDIAAIVSPALTGAPLTTTDNTLTDAAFPGAELASDSLLIPLRGMSPAGEEVLAAVRYEVQARDGRRVLTRTQKGLYGEETGAEPVNVAPGVVHFDVQCAGPEDDWREAWTEASLPRSVRVSLVLANPERPERQVARAAVFTVTVR